MLNVSAMDVATNILILTEKLIEILKCDEADPNPDEWNSILAQREEQITQLSKLQALGTKLNEQEKELLKKSHQLDQEILSLMKQQQSHVEEQLQQVNKAKTASKQYAGETTQVAYGAFFDKKK
ncbi:flagellar protein FliT [Brevibacillus laterosporus]|nr:flagellar protein FliT [Brevibacillus laterosporus]TPG69946.1 flagellar protein FliT [Brevibacillus laterosporus]TPG85794.1 flagellar protein FliT [Brevibacillus laterosporus]